MIEWIDISVPVSAGMAHWPGDPEIEVKRRLSLDNGDTCNVTELALGAHTGTHMDAPLHYLQAGAGMETMPLEATIGPARVVEIDDEECIRVSHLEGLNLVQGERLLFKTRNSKRCWERPEFVEDFVYVSAAAAEFLAQAKVRTVGIDYLSVGGFTRDSTETHVALLRAGIWIIEGLNLHNIEPGQYELVCLPLKLTGADGAPARAVLGRNRPPVSFEHRETTYSR